MMKRYFFILMMLPQLLIAQIQITHQSKECKDCFTIADKKTVVSIYYDTTEHLSIHKTATLFASDIEKVTGQKPRLVTNNENIKGHVVIIGTIGKNKLIDQLIKDEIMVIDSIKGEWERFVIQTVDNPFKGVKKALVIAGSDKRGAAYGTFTFSEKLGVSPWYWWADVPVKRSNSIYIKDLTYLSKAPSVKYRGVFLNDEDWGLHPWAARNIDQDVKDIGPNTYEKIFELLLRLKANMVAPAMHECTKAFYTIPGNMEKASEYGIMITTSHCEPLLYNNASEWDKKTQGEWNYVHNKEEINKALENRVKQAYKNENIYTIALRGMHDEGMKGGSDDEKLQALADAIKDQRALLSKYMEKPISEVPQVFVPYKEVLGLYEKGLEVPEDITIVWPDDNYGYIKKLSNEEEQKRAGSAGVYYHISYLGWPNDYLWLNTTPPALMYAEMQKAYSLGSDRYWLVNVGDIKPGEMGMQLFLDMAWDFNRFSFENINNYQVNFLTSIFGQQYQKDFEYILDRYYYHGFTRKPEYMTWDWRWNSLFQVENVKDTEFSFVHYREAETRLNEYNAIALRAEKIMSQLSDELKAPFFELVYYPVKGASIYNHEMLTGQKNRWYAKQGRLAANQLAADVKLYHDSLAAITKEYNSLLNGKWDGMMTAPGFLPKVQLSPTEKVEPEANAVMGIFVEGMESEDVNKLRLPVFYAQYQSQYFFEIYSKGKQTEWKASPSAPFIKLRNAPSSHLDQVRCWVSIDWDAVPSSSIQEEKIAITIGDNRYDVKVIIDNRIKETDHLYTVNNGVIGINPTSFQLKHETDEIKLKAIVGLGYANAALQLGNAQYDDGQGAYAEYDFYADSVGDVGITVYMLPLFAKDKSHSTRYSVQIDDQEAQILSNDVKEYSKDWASNVIRNSAINKVRFELKEAGKHTLRIGAVDPGMIVQKIVIDLGGAKKSYLGPISKF